LSIRPASCLRPFGQSAIMSPEGKHCAI